MNANKQTKVKYYLTKEIKTKFSDLYHFCTIVATVIKAISIIKKKSKLEKNKSKFFKPNTFKTAKLVFMA